MATYPKTMQHEAQNMRLLTLKFRNKPPTVPSVMAQLGVDKVRAEEILSFAREKLPDRVKEIFARFLHGESPNVRPPHEGCSAISEIYESLCPTGSGSCECRMYECEEDSDVERCEPLN